MQKQLAKPIESTSLVEKWSKRQKKSSSKAGYYQKPPIEDFQLSRLLIVINSYREHRLRPDVFISIHFPVLQGRQTTFIDRLSVTGIKSCIKVNRMTIVLLQAYTCNHSGCLIERPYHRWRNGEETSIISVQSWILPKDTSTQVSNFRVNMPCMHAS